MPQNSIISTLPSPFKTIVIENLRGTYKDFHASADYPLKGVVYPVDYGYLPSHTGEDGSDLDFFVGSETNGLSGFIRVFRPDTTNGETKFFVGATTEEVEAIYEAFKPVLIGRQVFQNRNELLKAVEKFR